MFNCFGRLGLSQKLDLCKHLIYEKRKRNKSKREDFQLKTTQALHNAIQTGSVDETKLLVKKLKMIESDVKNCILQSSLYLAIEECDQPEIITILIKAGADVNMLNIFSDNTLNYLIKRRDENSYMMLEKANILFQKCSDSFIKYDKDLFLNVLEFCRFDKLNENCWIIMLEMLLFYGANIHLPDSQVFDIILFENPKIFEILLPYIPDFNENICTRLPSDTLFLAAIESKSDYVYYMIQQGSDINLNNGVQSCLELSMTHSMKLFEYIFTHCNDETIINVPHLPRNFIVNNIFNVDQFVHCINLMFEHKLCAEIFSDCQEVHIRFARSFNMLEISMDDQLHIIYSLLMYNNTLTLKELNDIYHYYSYDDRFEAYLRVTVRLNSFRRNYKPHNMLVNCLCFPDKYQPHMMKSFPTLQVLCRNCVRSNIHKDLIYGANKVCFKYYYYLMQLDVPLIVKEILTLRRMI